MNGMKNKIIGVLLVTLIFAPGCKKWLDVKPKTIVEENQLFTTEKGFEDAMYGVYTIMANASLYGDQLTMSFLDVLAQQYDCSTRPTHIFYQASLYNYADATVKTRIAGVWDSMYNAIINVNNVLLNIDGKKGLFQSGNYELVKGEAIGLRAFMHFDLLRMFGGAYATHPSQAAIPYVTTVSGGVTPLSTVSQILDSVIADLTTASGLLSGYKNIDANFAFETPNSQNDWLNRRQSHFNYWAAEATLARVYLYKGDKQQALLHATNLINSNMFTFETTTRVANYLDKTFIPEQIFALSKFNLRPQVQTYFHTPAGTISSNGDLDSRLTNDYGSGGVVDQLYEITSGGVTDIRYANLWQLSGNTYFCSKYWQDAPRQEFVNLVPLLRLPEMYYIAAECSDPATATDYLNVVRKQRGVNDLPAGLDAAAIQNEILKEYQREFYAEGQMFYYYKRLNISQIRFTTIPGSDKVYIFPLPDAELQYRGN
jgi:hypothetical protein